MHRLIAGVGVLALALTACGARVPDGPPPHIVALGVAAATPAPEPAPEAEVVLARASRGATRVQLASANVPITGDVWGRLARCESGGNPRAIGGHGRFYGAFQFTLRTWHGIGMTGNPIDYSYADQLAAAQRLQARSGWRNWPVCARRALRG
ncbi:MAG TPA: transglycosylase family protein [Acidimicrobiales bacterium]|nr:transglycosylase family protein [Acidimicrobiales bacterium]